MISSRLAACLAAVCCMMLNAAPIIDSLDGPQWKYFPYVKDGDAAYRGTDKVLKLSARPDGRGLHYFFDRTIANRPDLKLTVSFEYRTLGTVKGKSWLTPCVYLNNNGSYLGAAASFGSISFTGTEMSEWKKFSRTVTLPTQAGKNKQAVTDGKFSFALTKGGTVEIRNLTLEESPAAR